MVIVRLALSISVAVAFAWLGIWLIGSPEFGFPARLEFAGIALLVGAPAWAFVTNGVLKALEPALARAPQRNAEPRRGA